MNNLQCWLRRTSWTVIHPGIHLQYYSGTRVNKGLLRGWVIPTCNNKEHMLCLILYVQEGQSCFHSYRLRLQNCNQIGVLACKCNFTAGVHKNPKTTYPPQNDRDILYLCMKLYYRHCLQFLAVWRTNLSVLLRKGIIRAAEAVGSGLQTVGSGLQSVGTGFNNLLSRQVMTWQLC